MRDKERQQAMLGDIQRNFQEWVDKLSKTKKTYSPKDTVKTWYFSGFVIFIFMIMATAVKPVSALFAIPAMPALLSVMLFLVPSFALSRSTLLLYPTESLSKRQGLSVIFSTTLSHLFLFSMANLSNIYGAVFFYVMILFAAAYQGNFSQASFSHPYIPLAIVFAALLSLPFVPTEEHRAITLLMLPLLVALPLLFGFFSFSESTQYAHAERLTAAVQAQILSQRNQELEKMFQSFVTLLGYQHDISNTLTTALLNAELLQSLALQKQALQPEEFEDLATDLSQSLTHIAQLVAEMKQHARNARDIKQAENVDVQSLVRDVATKTKNRLRNCTLSYRGDMTSPFTLEIIGGRVALFRSLENVLLNASEGDGEKAAKEICITIQRDNSGSRLEIIVEDDGPGFSAEQLARPIEGFFTTKQAGTGLGLYTTQQLLHASGGELLRENLKTGGAKVTLLFPLASVTS